MSRTRVKFNALKDTELSTADTETSAKGVITFTDKRIRVGLGGDKKIDYMPATPDNVVTLDNAQTIPSEKTFTDTLLYSSSRTIADKSNTEVVVKKDIVEHLDGYVTKDTDEVITGNKTFNGSLLKESSITSLNDLSDNEVPNKQQLLNKLSEYVEKSGFTAPINFIGEIANFSSLPSSATKGDCYYTNQPPEKKGFWLKSDTGWLNLGTGVEINLDGFANVNTPNEFTKATVFNTSIEVRDNSGSILKADTNAVVVNKPLKALSVQVNPNALEFVTKEWFEKSTQTIQGLKTFTTPPKLLSPATIAQHAVNKTYVDTMVNAMSVSKGNNVVKNRPPTTNDTSYRNGVLWVNVGENPEIYIRTSNSWYGIHSETNIPISEYTSADNTLTLTNGGVGLAPADIVKQCDMTGQLGFDDPESPNFGNYIDPHGSYMVWIPRTWFRTSLNSSSPYNGLKVEAHPDPDPSERVEYNLTTATHDPTKYWLPYAFINNGKMIDGFFMDKSICGYENNRYVCKPNLKFSTSSYFPTPALRGPYAAFCWGWHFNVLTLIAQARYFKILEEEGISGLYQKIHWAKTRDLIGPITYGYNNNSKMCMYSNNGSTSHNGTTSGVIINEGGGCCIITGTTGSGIIDPTINNLDIRTIKNSNWSPELFVRKMRMVIRNATISPYVFVNEYTRSIGLPAVYTEELNTTTRYPRFGNDAMGTRYGGYLNIYGYVPGVGIRSPSADYPITMYTRAGYYIGSFNGCAGMRYILVPDNRDA